ncbi:MAG TPA: hypothetical protein ENK57_25510 [Polyangiaceae bacterium]|nr:hypothetical protein [Polyangiaceae bacterium]
MTIRFGVAQGLRGLVALAFPLLWKVQARWLLGGSVAVAALAYVAGRAAVARGGRKALPLADAVTPFGESVMVAAACALAIRATATEGVHGLGVVEGGGLVAAALVAHWVGLPLVGRRDEEVSADRVRMASIAGLVGELALSVALLTVAASALGATLSGPIGSIQLLASPWPALLAMGLAYFPMVRLSLAESEVSKAPRRAVEAAAVILTGVLLVGLGGPHWWP